MSKKWFEQKNCALNRYGVIQSGFSEETFHSSYNNHKSKIASHKSNFAGHKNIQNLNFIVVAVVVVFDKSNIKLATISVKNHFFLLFFNKRENQKV